MGQSLFDFRQTLPPSPAASPLPSPIRFNSSMQHKTSADFVHHKLKMPSFSLFMFHLLDKHGCCELNAQPRYKQYTHLLYG